VLLVLACGFAFGAFIHAKSLHAQHRGSRSCQA
jgi:hypothetical protein